MLSFALGLLVGFVIPVQAGDVPCSFTVAPGTARPEITGPAETASHSLIVVQPDSPLRILSADLTGATTGSSGSGGGTIRFDVVNASNRPIEGAAVGFRWGPGSSPTTGAATFTTTLAPAAKMRLEARLPGTSSEGTPLNGVVMYVRSANIGGCTFEPGFMEAWSRAAPREAADKACAFNAAASDAPPEVDGPPELLTRLQVVEQPRSPLRIRRVNVSRLHLNIGDTWTQLRGSYEIEVENVSDRAIDHAAVLLATRARGTPAGGEGPAWKASLEPGKSRTLEAKVARFDDIPPGATAADVRLVALVGPVVFSGCNYVPSRGYSAK